MWVDEGRTSSPSLSSIRRWTGGWVGGWVVDSPLRRSVATLPTWTASSRVLWVSGWVGGWVGWVGWVEEKQGGWMWWVGGWTG